jgi:hypothetical protein
MVQSAFSQCRSTALPGHRHITRTHAERINWCWSDPIRYGASQHPCLWTTRRQLSSGCDELLFEMHDALHFVLLASAAAARSAAIWSKATPRFTTYLSVYNGQADIRRMQLR